MNINNLVAKVRTEHFTSRENDEKKQEDELYSPELLLDFKARLLFALVDLRCRKNHAIDIKSCSPIIILDKFIEETCVSLQDSHISIVLVSMVCLEGEWIPIFVVCASDVITVFVISSKNIDSSLQNYSLLTDKLKGALELKQVPINIEHDISLDDSAKMILSWCIFIDYVLEKLDASSTTAVTADTINQIFTSLTDLPTVSSSSFLFTLWIKHTIYSSTESFLHKNLQSLGNSAVNSFRRILECKYFHVNSHVEDSKCTISLHPTAEKFEFTPYVTLFFSSELNLSIFIDCCSIIKTNMLKKAHCASYIIHKNTISFPFHSILVKSGIDEETFLPFIKAFNAFETAAERHAKIENDLIDEILANIVISLPSIPFIQIKQLLLQADLFHINKLSVNITNELMLKNAVDSCNDKLFTAILNSGYDPSHSVPLLDQHQGFLEYVCDKWSDVNLQLKHANNCNNSVLPTDTNFSKYCKMIEELRDRGYGLSAIVNVEKKSKYEDILIEVCRSQAQDIVRNELQHVNQRIDQVLSSNQEEITIWTQKIENLEKTIFAFPENVWKGVEDETLNDQLICQAATRLTEQMMESQRVLLCTLPNPVKYLKKSLPKVGEIIDHPELCCKNHHPIYLHGTHDARSWLCDCSEHEGENKFGKDSIMFGCDTIDVMGCDWMMCVNCYQRVVLRAKYKSLLSTFCKYLQVHIRRTIIGMTASASNLVESKGASKLFVNLALQNIPFVGPMLVEGLQHLSSMQKMISNREKICSIYDSSQMDRIIQDYAARITSTFAIDIIIPSTMKLLKKSSHTVIDVNDIPLQNYDESESESKGVSKLLELFAPEIFAEFAENEELSLTDIFNISGLILLKFTDTNMKQWLSDIKLLPDMQHHWDKLISKYVIHFTNYLSIDTTPIADAINIGKYAAIATSPFSTKSDFVFPDNIEHNWNTKAELMVALKLCELMKYNRNFIHYSLTYVWKLPLKPLILKCKNLVVGIVHVKDNIIVCFRQSESVGKWTKLPATSPLHLPNLFQEAPLKVRGTVLTDAYHVLKMNVNSSKKLSLQQYLLDNLNSMTVTFMGHSHGGSLASVIYLLFCNIVKGLHSNTVRNINENKISAISIAPVPWCHTSCLERVSKFMLSTTISSGTSAGSNKHLVYSIVKNGDKFVSSYSNLFGFSIPVPLLVIDEHNEICDRLLDWKKLDGAIKLKADDALTVTTTAISVLRSFSRYLILSSKEWIRETLSSPIERMHSIRSYCEAFENIKTFYSDGIIYSEELFIFNNDASSTSQQQFSFDDGELEVKLSHMEQQNHTSSNSDNSKLTQTLKAFIAKQADAKVKKINMLAEMKKVDNGSTSNTTIITTESEPNKDDDESKDEKSTKSKNDEDNETSSTTNNEERCENSYQWNDLTLMLKQNNINAAINLLFEINVDTIICLDEKRNSLFHIFSMRKRMELLAVLLMLFGIIIPDDILIDIEARYPQVAARKLTLSLFDDICALDVNSKNNSDNTALSLAVDGGYSSIVRLLLLHPHISTKESAEDNLTKIPVLFKAIQYQYFDIFDMIISHSTVDYNEKGLIGFTLLQFAVLKENAECVKHLLSLSIHLNINDKSNLMSISAFEMAVITKNAKIIGLFLKDPRTIVDENSVLNDIVKANDVDLFKYGVEKFCPQLLEEKLYHLPSTDGNESQNLFIEACTSDADNIVRYFLDVVEVDPSRIMYEGLNLLMISLINEAKDSIIDRLVSDERIDINYIFKHEGKEISALGIVLRLDSNEAKVNYLKIIFKKAGARVDLSSIFLNLLLSFATELPHTIDIDMLKYITTHPALNETYLDFLHLPVIYRVFFYLERYDCLQYLILQPQCQLDCKLDISAIGGEDSTLFHLAAAIPDNNISIQMLSYLVKQEKALSVLDNLNKSEFTALTFCCCKSLDIVKVLVENGADATKVGPNSHPPLVVAVRCKNHEVVEYLLTQQHFDFSADILNTCLYYCIADNDMNLLKLFLSYHKYEIKSASDNDKTVEVIITIANLDDGGSVSKPLLQQLKSYVPSDLLSLYVAVILNNVEAFDALVTCRGFDKSDSCVEVAASLAAHLNHPDIVGRFISHQMLNSNKEDEYIQKFSFSPYAAAKLYFNKGMMYMKESKLTLAELCFLKCVSHVDNDFQATSAYVALTIHLNPRKLLTIEKLASSTYVKAMFYYYNMEFEKCFLSLQAIVSHHTNENKVVGPGIIILLCLTLIQLGSLQQAWNELLKLPSDDILMERYKASTARTLDTTSNKPDEDESKKLPEVVMTQNLDSDTNNKENSETYISNYVMLRDYTISLLFYKLGCYHSAYKLLTAVHQSDHHFLEPLVIQAEILHSGGFNSQAEGLCRSLESKSNVLPLLEKNTIMNVLDSIETDKYFARVELQQTAYEDKCKELSVSLRNLCSKIPSLDAYWLQNEESKVVMNWDFKNILNLLCDLRHSFWQPSPISRGWKLATMDLGKSEETFFTEDAAEYSPFSSPRGSTDNTQYSTMKKSTYEELLRKTNSVSFSAKHFELCRRVFDCDKLIPLTSKRDRALNLFQKLPPWKRKYSAKKLPPTPVDHAHVLFKTIQMEIENINSMIEALKNEESIIHESIANLEKSFYTQNKLTQLNTVKNEIDSDMSQNMEVLSKMLNDLKCEQSISIYSKVVLKALKCYLETFVMHFVEYYGHNSDFYKKNGKTYGGYLRKLVEKIYLGDVDFCNDGRGAPSIEELAYIVIASEDSVQTIPTTSDTTAKRNLLAGYDVDNARRRELYRKFRFRKTALEVLKSRDHKIKDDEETSSHYVVAHDNVFYKLYPYAPGIEFAVNSINRILLDELAVPMRLIRLEGLSPVNWKEVAIYQASIRVPGVSFDKLLAKHPKYIDYIDVKSFSALFISSVLVGTGDAKPDNLIAQVDRNPQNLEQISVKLIDIDKDISFCSGRLGFKRLSTRFGGKLFSDFLNTLFFLPQMDVPLHSEIQECLCRTFYRPEEIVSDWLRQLYVQNEHYMALKQQGFTDADMKILKLPIKLRKAVELNEVGFRSAGTAEAIYDRILKLSEVLSYDKEITHSWILREFYPGISTHYESKRQSLRKASFNNNNNNNNTKGGISIIHSIRDFYIEAANDPELQHALASKDRIRSAKAWKTASSSKMLSPEQFQQRFDGSIDVVAEEFISSIDFSRFTNLLDVAQVGRIILDSLSFVSTITLCRMTCTNSFDQITAFFKGLETLLGLEDKRITSVRKMNLKLKNVVFIDLPDSNWEYFKLTTTYYLLQHRMQINISCKHSHNVIQNNNTLQEETLKQSSLVSHWKTFQNSVMKVLEQYTSSKENSSVTTTKSKLLFLGEALFTLFENADEIENIRDTKEITKALTSVLKLIQDPQLPDLSALFRILSESANIKLPIHATASLDTSFTSSRPTAAPADEAAIRKEERNEKKVADIVDKIAMKWKNEDEICLSSQDIVYRMILEYPILRTIAYELAKKGAFTWNGLLKVDGMQRIDIFTFIVSLIAHRDVNGFYPLIKQLLQKLSFNVKTTQDYSSIHEYILLRKDPITKYTIADMIYRSKRLLPDYRDVLLVDIINNFGQYLALHHIIRPIHDPHGNTMRGDTFIDSILNEEEEKSQLSWQASDMFNLFASSTMKDESECKEITLLIIAVAYGFPCMIQEWKKRRYDFTRMCCTQCGLTLFQRMITVREPQRFAIGSQFPSVHQVFCQQIILFEQVRKDEEGESQGSIEEETSSTDNLLRYYEIVNVTDESSPQSYRFSAKNIASSSIHKQDTTTGTTVVDTDDGRSSSGCYYMYVYYDAQISEYLYTIMKALLLEHYTLLSIRSEEMIDPEKQPPPSSSLPRKDENEEDGINEGKQQQQPGQQQQQHSFVFEEIRNVKDAWRKNVFWRMIPLETQYIPSILLYPDQLDSKYAMNKSQVQYTTWDIAFANKHVMGMKDLYNDWKPPSYIPPLLSLQYEAHPLIPSHCHEEYNVYYHLLRQISQYFRMVKWIFTIEDAWLLDFPIPCITNPKECQRRIAQFLNQPRGSRKNTLLYAIIITPERDFAVLPQAKYQIMENICHYGANPSISHRMDRCTPLRAAENLLVTEIHNRQNLQRMIDLLHQYLPPQS